MISILFGRVEDYWPLSAPAVRPAMSRREPKTVISSIGNVAMELPTSSAPVSVPWIPFRLARATGYVYMLGSDINVSGPRNEFQPPMKLVIARAPAAGAASGSTMRQKTPNSPQPSMRAASNSSGGIALAMYCRIQKVPKALPIDGTMNGRNELVQPKWVISMYHGMSPNCPGINIVSSNTQNNSSFRGKLYRANA